MNKNTMAIIKPNETLKLFGRVFIDTSDFLEKLCNPKINQSLINRDFVNAQTLAIAQPSETTRLIAQPNETTRLIARPCTFTINNHNSIGE